MWEMLKDDEQEDGEKGKEGEDEESEEEEKRDEEFHFLVEEELPSGYNPGEMLF